MKKPWNHIVLGLAALAVLLLVFLGGQSYQKSRGYSEYERYFQKQKDSLELVIKQQKLDLEKLMPVRDSLEARVSKLEEDLKKSKEKYGQKITIVSTYSNPQLEQFFTDRYGN